MCGRFTLYQPLQALLDYFYLSVASLDYEPRFNIAPSQAVLAVVSDGEQNRLGYLKWGLIPHWAKDPSIGHKLINARAETLMEKPSFRESYQKRRCLIPADGFYEWKRTAEGKVPLYIRLRQQPLFTFAGLWERWISPSGERITTCTIITTEPNELMRDIHQRMPVILNREQERVWLDRNADRNTLELCLRPYPAQEMEAYEVSRAVNSPRTDEPKLIEKLG
jgi:putative SOS response-associated peptidase YedK